MIKQRANWYPVSAMGLVCTVLYAMVPPYIVYAQSSDTLPDNLRIPLILGMAFIIVCMLVCRYTGQKPFHRKNKR